MADGVVYVSGTLALDKDNNVVHVGDAAAQTEHVLKTIKSVIETAGGTMADVTFNPIFITDWANYAAINRVYAKYLPGRQAGAVLHPVRPGEEGSPGRDRHRRACRQEGLTVRRFMRSMSSRAPGRAPRRCCCRPGWAAPPATGRRSSPPCASAIASSPTTRPAPAATAGELPADHSIAAWPTRCWPCSMRPARRPATSSATRWAAWPASISPCAGPSACVRSPSSMAGRRRTPIPGAASRCALPC